MSDRGDLMLEMLRAIRGDLSELKSDMAELKQRVGLLEGQYANLSNRVDRIAGDIVHQTTIVSSRRLTHRRRTWNNVAG